MKRKTFEFDESLAGEFEQFCRDRRLVEKQVVEALVGYFMQLGAVERENILLGNAETRREMRITPAAKKIRGPHATKLTPEQAQDRSTSRGKQE